MLRPELFKRLNSIPLLGGVDVSNTDEEIIYTVIKDVVRDKNVMNIESRGETYKVNCPFCGDTRHRLWINHIWGKYNEVTCSRNLWLCKCFNENCLVDYENQKNLYKMVFSDFVDDYNDKLFHGKVEVIDRKSPAPLPGELVGLNTLDSLHHARLYLSRRKFNVSQISKAFNLSYCVNAVDRYKTAEGRIVIPIYHEGILVGWQARLCYETDNKGLKKYWTMPKFKKSHFLYNYDRAKGFKNINIVEGCTGVWRYGPEAVGIFGKTMDDPQIDLIINCNPDYITVMLDGGIEEVECTKKIIKKIEKRMPVKSKCKILPTFLPVGRDPGNLSTTFIRALVKKEING